MPSLLSNTKFRCLGCGAVEDIEEFPRECGSCDGSAWQQIVVTPVCDFCAINLLPGEGWTHDCKPFAVIPAGEAPAWGSGLPGESADWAACDTCHGFITRNERSALALRAVKRLIKLHPEVGPLRAMVFADITLAHEGFFRSATGEFHREEEPHAA